MNGLSVIIPSKTASNLVPCIEAVSKMETKNNNLRLFVVDDGVRIPEEKIKADAVIDGHRVIRVAVPEWEPNGLIVHFIDGIKPFCFSRNCNLGIQASGEDDVVLLNDDALLESSGGFSRMQRFAQEHHDVGLISASTNIAGNPAQWRQEGDNVRILTGKTPGNSFPTVAFVCVYLPRSTINLVGLLDERFGGIGADGKPIYGWEDNDYCRRLELAGLRIAVHDGCFVDHSKLKSSFRGEPRAAGAIDEGRRIYMEKLGERMIPYKDLADEPEDERIKQIGEKVMKERMIVGFFTDAEEGKADRYIRKLRERFPGIRVITRVSGPTPETVLVKVGPPTQ